MYRNFMPILATLIISAGTQHVYAASHQPVYQQQAESQCAVCHHQENLDDALFLVCNDHLLITHKACMRGRLESGDMHCPACSHALSEENLDLMLTSIFSGNVMSQVTSVEPKAQPKATHWKLVNMGWRSLEDSEAGYTELKRLVFEKMGPDFATTFNRQYPQSSKEAVEELARCIDYTSSWLECYPPKAIATIGSKEMYLTGDIANIIYDMDGIPCRTRCFFTLND